VKVLIIEPHADGLLDLALRAQMWGHDVRYFLRDYDPVKQPVGRGLVERVNDWRPSMRWADLVILGSLGYCQAEFDKWASEGVPIIGAPGEVAAWELDRIAGMRAFERAGTPVPRYHQCATIQDAIVQVGRDDGFKGNGVAIKPCGDVTDKSLSFVAKSGKEAEWRLSRWKKEGKRFPQGLILQERIEGVEFAVGAWVGPSGFAPGWEENFEEKRLFAGNLGPNCGEAGTAMRLVKTSKLADKVLKPFEDRLVSLGYVGNIDVNCIVSDDGVPFPLEWTVRFGYPAINIELALHDGDPIEFLAGLAAGAPPNSRKMDEVAVGVVLALPPYPFGHETTEEVVNVPIWGVTPAIEDSLHFVMVQHGKDELTTAGSYVLVGTGTGHSVTEARKGAYRTLNRLTIPASPFWRIDVGSRLRSGLPKLQQSGYAKGLEY
jgi:phosphoribosylamine---glycine ligase